MSHQILIVDDEQHVLQAIKRSLRRDGYEIHSADNGAAALKILSDREIAVIICDQRMPGMSGAEVLAKSIDLRPDAFRITLTGYSDMEAIQTSINEGRINHFLLKPWEDDHLRQVVRSGVRAYQLITENRRLQALTRQQKEELERWNRQLEDQVEQRTAELHTQNRQLLDLQRCLEQSLRDTVDVLVVMLEANSPNVGLHSKRVAKEVVALGKRLDLPDQALQEVEFVALLHDLGKIAKRHRGGEHRSKRATHVRQRGAYKHSDSGYAILSHVKGFENIAHGIRHQHERHDGSGYPDGLKADQIPIGSRLLAIVDAYDEAVYSATNLTTLAHEAGRKLLLEDKGRRFDPTLAELFLDCQDSIGTRACSDAEVELSPDQLVPGMMLSRAVDNADGVLLVRRGASLTHDLIERIRRLNAHDPMLNSVFVRCTPDSPSEKEGPVSKKPSSGTPLKQDSADGAAPARRASRKTPPSGADFTAAILAAVSDDTSGNPGNPTESAQHQSPRDPQSPSAQKATKTRILVADDSQSIRNALARELRRAGFETLSASDGQDALGLLRNNDPDLVITDLAMPGMSGEELIQRLHERAPNLPCIILSGKATMDQVRRLSKAPNVAGILVKPWDHDRLIDSITAAFADFHRERVREVV